VIQHPQESHPGVPSVWVYNAGQFAQSLM